VVDRKREIAEKGGGGELGERGGEREIAERG